MRPNRHTRDLGKSAFMAVVVVLLLLLLLVVVVVVVVVVVEVVMVTVVIMARIQQRQWAHLYRARRALTSTNSVRGPSSSQTSCGVVTRLFLFSAAKTETAKSIWKICWVLWLWCPILRLSLSPTLLQVLALGFGPTAIRVW
jgi:hypothetical protein